MKNLVILGAGTAGTVMANHLVKKLSVKEWQITVIDQDPRHFYQPGFLFIPFDMYNEKQVTRGKASFIPKKCNFILSEVDNIDAEKNVVNIKSGKKKINYDILIIATGSRIVPEEVEGLAGSSYYKNIFDFYTIDGAVKLRQFLQTFTKGKLVLNIAEIPIKCPVAPLEFVFLADWFFTKKGVRENIDLTFVTPLSDAFTKEKTAAVLSTLLNHKNINIVTDFSISKVDSDEKQIVSFDEKNVEYDLLVTIPTNMGSAVIERSGLGDDLEFVPTHRSTLQSKEHDNIFVIGDATDLPTSKAGSVAHFEAEILTENILRYINNLELKEEYDGHANCFIESGFGKGFLIDFNYDVEPVPGKFPFPVIGPMSLLKESKLNHWGKLAFRWIYWYVMLKGLPIPGITATMSTKGKQID